MADRDRIAEFKEVAELMPDDPVVRFGLAGAYLEAGQAERAILEYEETIRLSRITRPPIVGSAGRSSEPDGARRPRRHTGRGWRWQRGWAGPYHPRGPRGSPCPSPSLMRRPSR